VVPDFVDGLYCVISQSTKSYTYTSFSKEYPYSKVKEICTMPNIPNLAEP